MRLKTRIRTAIQDGADGELERLISQESRAVRHLLGLTYHDDPGIRTRAARAVAFASKHHPAMLESIIRQLVWAMNDESGTNSLTAPQVLQAIADESPDLLIPVVPDLVRLSAEPEFHEELTATLRTLSRSCPGQISRSMTESLKEMPCFKGSD